jgi:hypothetical protein
MGIVIGVLSYLAYGKNIQSMILYNLPDNYLGLSVKISYMISVAGAYVLALMPVFSVIENYNCFKNCHWCKNESKPYFARLVTVLLIWACGLPVPNIGTMISFGGSISGTIITIIIPVFLYNEAFKNSPKKAGKRRFNQAYLIFGVILGCFGLILSTLKVVLTFIGVETNT